MHPIEGKPPTPIDPDQRKYLLDKLSEIRKSCEWLVTLGAASILANLIKGAPAEHCLRKPTFVVVVVQMALALFGAAAWLTEDVDPAQVEQRLRRTLRWRYWVRNASLLLIVVAFVMLLLQTW
jgi:hypothetical protein